MIRGTPGLRCAATDAQSEPAMCLCRRCGGEMYSGETAFCWEGLQMCMDCFKTVVTVWLEEATREVAQTLGVETRAL